MLRALVLVFATVFSLAGQAADLVVNEDRQTGTRDCAGGAITLNSNRNTLKLQGCTRIVVNGNFNVIDAVAPAAISVLGNDNRVNWSVGADGRAPNVSNLGNRNQVKAGNTGATHRDAAIGLAAGGLATEDTHSCAAGSTCRADCPAGNCTMTCPAGAICHYGCAGGDCLMQCSAGAKCDFSCHGGNCRQTCATGARCETSCAGGDCSS